ncbi:hypothetical protein D3C78_1685600 [compost metagenome]
MSDGSLTPGVGPGLRFTAQQGIQLFVTPDFKIHVEPPGKLHRQLRMQPGAATTIRTDTAGFYIRDFPVSTLQPFEVALGIRQAQPLMWLFAEPLCYLGGMQPAVHVEAHGVALVIERNDPGRHAATF